MIKSQEKRHKAYINKGLWAFQLKQFAQIVEKAW